MDVSVVRRTVKTKDKTQDNQDKEKNTDEVQREYKRIPKQNADGDHMQK
jgi:hypothetical protein